MATLTAISFFSHPQIATFLENGLDDGAKKVLKEKKNDNAFSTQTPIEVLDHALRGGNASSESIYLFQFLKSLCAYCIDAADVADPDLGGLGTLNDRLVELLFPRYNLDTLVNLKDNAAAAAPTGALLEETPNLPPKELTAAVLDRLRGDVFNREPLRTINRLVAQGKFETSIPVSIAAGVQAILSTMTEEAVNIGSPDLLARAATRITTFTKGQDVKKGLPEASEVVQSLKGLARMTEDPEDIPIIYGRRYRTIRQVTEADKENWIMQMVKYKMKKENALKAYDCAERIECWNENLWLSLMHSRRAKYTNIAAREIQQMEQDEEDDEISVTAQSNLTDIFKLEDLACETCCSVTSLSAYYADLLSLLRSTVHGSTDLLESLRLRRPDLTKLQLTCANAQTLIPYVSLVNEVLESFIAFNTTAGYRYDSVLAFNTPDNGGHNHSDAAVYRPGNTNAKVYEEISKQMFPFSDFPYNQARDAVAQYFTTFRVTMLELITTFQATELVLRDIPASILTSSGEEAEKRRLRIESGVCEVMERHRAAERLGMQLADFVAITGETFYPAWFAELVMGLSKSKLEIDTGCPWTAADLWGYDAAALLDPQKGLSRIKKQLMRRSGLTFQNILDLVKTQCFGQHLVITNETGSDEFTNSLEELRLLSSAAEPPFKPLTEELAFSMQSFMRVQAKLGWSVKQVDAAVVCLRNVEMATSPHATRTSNSTNVGPSRELISITPFVLKGLAAVVTLSELSDIEPAAILALWGPIDTYGEDSLMHRKFLTPAAAEVDKLFASPVAKSGTRSKLSDYFKLSQGPNKKPMALPLSLHKAGICVSLDWPIEFFDDLLAASEQKDKDLDVITFSALYRHVLLCRILSIPPTQSRAFFSLFFVTGGKAALADPGSIVTVIQQWKALFDAGWTVPTLSAVLLASNASPSAQVAITGLPTAVSILEGAKNIRKSVPFVSASGQTAVNGTSNGSEVATALNVADCAARTFDSATAPTVTEFIEGTKAQVRRVSIGVFDKFDNLAIAAAGLSYKITFTPEIDLNGNVVVELQLIGILSQGELEKSESLVIKDLPVDKTTDIKNAILEMATEAIQVRSKIETRFGSEKYAVSDLSKDWPEVIAKKEDEGALLSEVAMQVRKRRQAFVELAGPTIIQDLLEAFILNVVKELVPDLDVSLVAVIISRIARVTSPSDKNTTQSVMTAMKLLSESTDKPSNEPLNAYFTPNSTDIFTLHYTGALTNQLPTLLVNGISISYNPNSKSFMSTRMRGGQAYLLVANFAASQLQWSTPKILPTDMNEKMMISSAITERASEINAAILRVVSICRAMSLTAEELGFFSKNGSSLRQMLALDLNAPSLKDLVQLNRYCNLRRNTSPPTTESQGNPLLSMLSWLSTEKSATLDQIASHINAGTGWDKTRIAACLSAKDPDIKDTDMTVRISSLRDVDSIYRLQAIMEVDDNLGRASGGLASQPSMATLFTLSQPPKLLSANVSSIARSLQTRLMPDQRAETDNRLMENQRRALVAYLLQQPYVRKDLKIWDADGLFEHFLIDVQMGPKLSTSRIKQAISVIQLFVQRCLLGMEKGVPKTCIVRAKWDWMRQYSLWEANRKLFLYPENWLDPAFRDDKSDLFENFEASLMQKNLSITTFVEGIRTYVTGLNVISNLEIVAYAHEPTTKVSDSFHIFGRTRAAPHQFYYRSLIVQWSDGGRLWKPWSKIEIDIPSVESGWDGSRLNNSGAYLLPVIAGGGRLYLFLPQVVPRTLDRKQDPNQKLDKFEDLRNTEIKTMAPRRIWEITMSWTELVNGYWSPKRMSPGSVTIESPMMPEASKFRVDTIQSSKTGPVTLLVSYTNSDDGHATVVGHFIFISDQISALDLTTGESSKADKATDYSNMSLPKQTTTVAKTPENEGTSKLALLAWVPTALDELNRSSIDKKRKVPEGQKDVTELTWTLAMDSKEQRLTGLAVSAKHSNGTNRTYFNVPRDELRNIWWTANNVRDKMDTVVVDHISATTLMEAAVNPTNPLQSVYNELVSTASSGGLEAFGAYDNRVCHELGQPSALYNWELGLHVVMLAMDRFHATQQFDEALQVARLVFDPTVDVDVERLIKSHPAGSAWRFPPFQDIARRIAANEKQSKIPPSFDTNSELQTAILERRSHGALVHATARGRPEAYMKWIIMKYVDILVASGDVHFRVATLESLPLATQRYIEATHVLGPEPPKINRFDDNKSTGRNSSFEQLSFGREPWTFEKLYRENMKFDINLPFSPELALIKGAPQNVNKNKTKENVVGFLRTPYFGVPLNPKFRQVRSVIEQRLFNVRNSLDIDGRPITYAVIEPSIDPGALVALSAHGFDNASAAAMVMGDRDSPLPRQRFDFLLHRALELCGEVRALGERLVSAIEKKESEAFSVLRAQHATSIQRMMRGIKETHLTEAQQTIDSLQLNRDSAVSQLAYYLALIGEPESLIPKIKDSWKDLKQDIGKPTQDDLRMSEHEEYEMDMATAAMVLNVVSAGIDALVAPFCMVPSVSINAMPMGVGTTVAAGGGSNIATCMQAGSAAIKMASMVVAEQGAQAGRKAQLTRQLQDRRMQANMRGREIKSIDKQIEIQSTRVKAAQQELQLQESEVEESAQVETWLRNKYTNEQLYGWVEKSLRNLYFQAYTLALSTARSAESALSFENGCKPSILRPGGYWDASRDGLLSADHLYLDLKRLEAAHRDGRRHDYEVTKTISLRQVDPMALMRLRISGSTTFSLNEMLFDMDFPGHYMRRIRSVAVTIPAVVGPHTGVNATLTLQQHKYRVLQTASTADEYASSWSSISVGNDEAFRTDRVPISAVAISSGAHDTGVFELNFAGDRYLPFEGAGVVSSWRIDLPTKVRRFDYDSIADVQLHLQYTSLEGGACLRGAANGAVENALKAVDNSSANRDNGLWFMCSLKNDFVNEWYGFNSQLAAAKKDKAAGAGDRVITMKLGDLYERLPFWARDRGTADAKGITLVSKSTGLVNAMTVSVAKGKWDSQSISGWQVRSQNKLQKPEWKGWEFSVTAKNLKESDKIEDVYMLVRYGKISTK
ncbi:hypothetical protein M441DRAFT_154811 [Trichoderma asperellum CBS 433.97]|uniref:Toxin subunit n=1 Tax=Trichoderma asperellum (strain ATCC 204424 / CBS 433.97 / NBRC 101777) TaxID=1042311 RepID=A0A2T3YQH6_TRIA4|nr:hypothetical protein M441DRAFT_154811 [Trichoderma asperellum CBS 433.97]PTB34818.1 hypothetical protein M441DRAFT_154811 [Trichoderma asperellum CBS 433.97]